MFNIELILGNLSNRYTPEMLSKAIQSLVNQGILEQYTDENGDFQFQITEFGTECAEQEEWWQTWSKVKHPTYNKENQNQKAMNKTNAPIYKI